MVNDPGRDDLDRHPLILQKHMEVRACCRRGHVASPPPPPLPPPIHIDTQHTTPRQTLTDYLQRVTLPALSEAPDPHTLLRAVGEQWRRFALLNSWLHKLLIFVVRARTTTTTTRSDFPTLQLTQRTHHTTPTAYESGAVLRGPPAAASPLGFEGAGRPAVRGARLLQPRVRKQGQPCHASLPIPVSASSCDTVPCLSLSVCVCVDSKPPPTQPVCCLTYCACMC